MVVSDVVVYGERVAADDDSRRSVNADRGFPRGPDDGAAANAGDGGPDRGVRDDLVGEGRRTWARRRSRFDVAWRGDTVIDSENGAWCQLARLQHSLTKP